MRESLVRFAFSAPSNRLKDWLTMQSVFLGRHPLRIVWSACVCSLFSIPAVRASTQFGAFAITHVTVIDGSNAAPQLDRTVLVSGDRIVNVTQSPPPAGAQAMDARGKFIIPGLCDMHVHLAGVTADPRWSKDTLLPLLIANGVTTVRDMGGDLTALQNWKKEIAEGKLVGPRIYCAGPMLDGGKSDPPALVGISRPNDGRAAVRDLKNKRVDFIKVLSRLDRESYFAVADESKKQGLPFVGHVPNSVRAAEASDAGQKSIEHIFYSNLAFDCSAREEELRDKASKARAKQDSTAAAAARDEANASFSEEKANALWQTLTCHKTWVVPTLVAIRTIAMQREIAASNPSELGYLPPALRANWSPNEVEKQVSSQVARWYLAQFQNDLKVARSMRSAGVQMLTGSDSLDPLNFPGPSLHEEIELFTQIGFTPLQALQAATSKPAEFFNASGADGWGTIAPGKAADLVLLEADPLADIRNTRRIAAVIRNGKLLARDDLNRMLERARAAAEAIK